ncbi:hypothetical protein ABH930_002525 [Kitasatospora sp. GAS204A]|uniref:hypothetical protein n=1 Tax=unclassified Kitasatospora TaxID=2633591 RepID=UPI0024734330|nr:hypothetical protein [Kitasatospora sp. GAS204B]MDH6119176.1 hypothetical protein [Kitasatospora sp. GAS204B]
MRSHDRTGAPSVWEIEDLTGQRWFAKRHWNDLLYQRETRAYDEFVPALGQRRAPWIADRDPDARLIVTRGLKGEPLSKVQLTGGQELEAFRQAGVLAARLHALIAAPAPGPAPSTPLRPQQRAKALDMAMDLGHGDFGPRNWIVHQRGELRLQLIDFERTTGGGAGAPRPDADRLPGHRAQARAGGGVLRRLRPRRLTEAEEAACRVYAALDCPSALKWAADHRDSEIHGYARRALDLLRASVRPYPTSRSSV